MSSNFAMSAYDFKQEFHIYTVECKPLSMLGIGSYTMSGMDKYFDRETDADFMKQVYGTPSTVHKQLIGDGETLELMKFNLETRIYELKQNSEIFTTNNGVVVASDLKTFFAEHEKFVLNKLTGGARENMIEVVNGIETSMSGCITYHANIRLFDKALDPKPFFRVHIKSPNLRTSNMTGERVLGNKVSVPMVGVAKNAAGLAYSPKATEKTGEGIYVPPLENGIGNPNNTIAAEVDYRFDSATGTWKGGTHQTLAILSTDLDPAPISPVNVSDLTNPEAGHYDPNSPAYVSQFSIGKAVPISLEQGNPHKCGPDVIGCPKGEGEKKVREVMVVNRSRRSFKKGDTVILSEINGEWITQGFDAGVISETPVKVGRWQFQKYIATLSNFFRAKWGDNPSVQSNPDIIESRLRKRYYTCLVDGDANTHPTDSSHPISMLNADQRHELARLNLYAEINPLTPEITGDNLAFEDWATQSKSVGAIQYESNYTPYPCHQMSVFDQLSKAMGGTNDYTFIGQTALIASANKTGDGFFYQKDFPFFWGPVFPNGYTSSSVTKRKSSGFTRSSIAMSPSGTPYVYNSTEGQGVVSNIEFTQSKYLVNDGSINIFSNESRINPAIGMNADPFDANAVHIPAEVALNGSLMDRTYGYPIEDTSMDLRSVNLIGFFQRYMSEGFASDSYARRIVRYNALLSHSENDKTVDVLDHSLTPTQPNVVQFSPLQLSLGMASLAFLDEDRLGLVDFDLQTKFIYESLGLAYPPPETGPELWGGFTERNRVESLGGLRRVIADTTSGHQVSTFLPFARFHPDREYFGALPTPAGSPFNTVTASDTIGIIAAKNKFTAPSNGKLKISATQFFGLPQKVTISGGQGGLVTILGPFVSWATGGTDIQQNGDPRWGDSTGSDNFDSTGTTALHVRIFDQWPDAQTVYLGHCFSVLHFNPIRNHTSWGSTAYKTELTYIGSNGVRTILQTNAGVSELVDVIETSVDMRIPTYDNKLTVPLGTIFLQGSQALRPMDKWNVDPLRRNVLLTKGGFVYRRAVIGINGFEVIANGADYALGDKLTAGRGSLFEVVGITDAGALTLSLLDRGVGFLPTEMAMRTVPAYDSDNETRQAYGAIYNLGGGSGSGAKLLVRSMIVYGRLGHDPAPEERVGITRLTTSSNRGQKMIDQTDDTTLSIVGGNGKYDAFYFFHNDVLHTLPSEDGFSAGFAQHVTINIGAG